MVLMGGGGCVAIFGAAFVIVPHWTRYMNRLDEVIGVEWIVLRDKSVTKSFYAIVTVVTCADCLLPMLCIPRYIPHTRRLQTLGSCTMLYEVLELLGCMNIAQT